jgi:hypothetical protein
VHQHVGPSLWAKDLPMRFARSLEKLHAQWSPKRAIEFMDSQEIAPGIRLVNLSSVVGWGQSERGDEF